MAENNNVGQNVMNNLRISLNTVKLELCYVRLWYIMLSIAYAGCRQY
jgi:hypothetical protein